MGLSEVFLVAFVDAPASGILATLFRSAALAKLDDGVCELHVLELVHLGPCLVGSDNALLVVRFGEITTFSLRMALICVLDRFFWQAPRYDRIE